MRLRKDKPIDFHFGEKGHTQHDMAFAVLGKVYAAERIERQLREGLWIKKLWTVRPGGCNVKDCFIPAAIQWRYGGKSLKVREQSHGAVGDVMSFCKQVLC